MRSYPSDSPQAAARIVALALLADGHLCKAEVDVLDRLRAHEQLGLGRDELHGVVHGFCEDLLTAAHLSWSGACSIDPRTLAALFAEIEDPALRCRVLRLCIDVVEADAQIGDGESLVLATAVEQWGPHRHMLEAPAAAC